jgi:hypothetical protein
MKKLLSGLCAGFLWAGVGLAQGPGLQIITPPLMGQTMACIVVNVSDHPLEVSVEIFDATGARVAGGLSKEMPPLVPNNVANSSILEPLAQVCRVVASDGKRGDVKVSFCRTGPSVGCLGAVSAE